MGFNGSGSYTPPPLPYYPAIPGEVIYAERWNFQWNELYTALGNVMLRDGQSAMITDLPMGAFRLSNMGAAVANGQAVEYGQWMAGFTGATLTNPTLINAQADTPPLISDNLSVANTEWVRDLFGTIPVGSLPPLMGKAGMFLTNDGAASLSWAPAPPDFVLMNLGVV